MATLIGIVPPDEALPRSVNAPPSPTANDETSLLPALTTSSQLPSADSVTEPCEPSPAPEPCTAGRDGRGRAQRSVGRATEHEYRVPCR